MAHAFRRSSGPFPDSTPDEELVHRAILGDEYAFEAIMRRNNQRLFRTARSILHDDDDAADAVQEAYLHAWRALGRFRAEARLSTWLIRIVVNESLGRLRSTSAEVIPLDGVMGSSQPEIQASLMEKPNLAPDQAAMRSEIRRILEVHIDSLPEMYRTVFMLRAVEEMSTAEVSEALGLPEATVRTRFFRARNLLQEELSSDFDATLGDAFSFDGERCDRIVHYVLSHIGRGSRH